MALKFLNKKGWHTGSLRNIENVWKAEQKHDQEQKKLEELRKQIQEEREKSEFRLIQEQAGLVPRQERLDFLYDSGLATGKGGSDGFKVLEALPKTEPPDAAAAAAAPPPPPLGALFEEKPQSANDAWRKLHSDPLLLIRQREQEALARIKNNPVQMARIRKSVEEEKKKKSSRKTSKRDSETEEKRRRSYDKYSSSKITEEDSASEGEERNRRSSHPSAKKVEMYSSRSESETAERKRRNYDKYSLSKICEEDSASEGEDRSRRSHRGDRKKVEKYSSNGRSESDTEETRKRSFDKYSSSKGRGLDKRDAGSREDEREKRSRRDDERKHARYISNDRSELESEENCKGDYEKSKPHRHSTKTIEAPKANLERPHQTHRRSGPKLSEEEKAARLREMQMDAVIHEEQRWKRLKKASEIDAKEESQASSVGGRSFLNDAQKSIYGAEKGGSSTIEESVRRRKYYSQGRSESNEGNAFRR